MKKIISTAQHYAIFAFLMFLLPVATLLAEEPDTFEDDTQDVAPMPIDEFVLPTLIIAILIAFYICQKQIKKQIL